MNPFYFAPRERALFGVYHPPNRVGGPYRGIVLCYPFGVEYMRAHRTFRQLTKRLTRSGFHVLRFDYFGTGDSAGAGTEGSLAQWRSDIEEAVVELRETAGLDRVTLIGLRLGASLALDVAEERPDVEEVIAWDPIVSGADHLRQVLRKAGSEKGEEGERGVGGFPLTPRVEAEMRALDLLEAPTGNSTVHVVLSKEEPAHRRLRIRLTRQGRLAGYHLVPEDAGWIEGGPFGAVLLPSAMVQAIVQVMTEGRGT